MKTKLHAIAGAIALLTILTFWLSSVYVELTGSNADIAFVKASILKGMIILIPSMMAVGASGFSLGGNWKGKLVARKKLRMKIIAANGMIVLLPSAVFLAMRSGAGVFDLWFYVVQGLELIAGAANIALIGLNIGDGLALGRRHKTQQSIA